MKQILRSLLVTFLITISVHISASAQTAGSATIGKDLVIHLNMDAPLVADYTFDISNLGFKAKEDAEIFFSRCRDNLMNYTVNFETKTATVHISLEYMEPRGWGLSEYNEYFSKVSEHYRSVFAAIGE